MAVSKVVYKESANATPVTWIDATPSTASASDILSPKTAMLANGVITTGTGTGGGGASNFVRGTFTASASEKGTSKDITVAYTGSGYPVSVVVYPSVGAYKSGSDIYELIQDKAIVMFCAVKGNLSTEPDYYDSTDYAKNGVMSFGIYKYGSSDKTSLSTGLNKDYYMYISRWGANEGHSTCVRVKSATTISVFVANTSYGFKDGIEYTYEIAYSS